MSSNMPLPMTILESSLCSGSFELAYATSLSKLASSPAQQFVRPDYYGPQAAWYRLAHIDALPVAIQVTKDGIVSWISPREIETARIQQKVKQLLVPLPLPDGALNHLPADLAHGSCRKRVSLGGIGEGDHSAGDYRVTGTAGAAPIYHTIW